MSAERRRLLVAALIFVATLGVYAPVRDHAFIDFDDDVSVTANPHLADGFDWGDVRRAFTEPYGSNWIPLTWISFGVDRALYGDSPAGHHLTNAVLHAASAALLCLALASATGALVPAAFVAAVFALHPLRVESVAWVSERKDVLAGLFFMLTLLAWVAYVRRPRALRYGAVVAAFAASLLAKPVTVTVPFVLLLLDYWPLARTASRRRLLLEKAPLLGLAAIVSLVTYEVQRRSGAAADLLAVPLLARIENAVVSVAWYAQKTFWPTDLAVFYPHPGDTIPAEAIGSASFALLAVTLLAISFVRRRPWLLVGWLWFVGMLVPMLGLVQVGMQARADRYAYLPVIGLQIAVAWEAWAWLGRERAGRAIAAALAGAALVALSIATQAQLRSWRDTQTLFASALLVTQDNFLAHGKVGRALLDAGDLDGAIEHFGAALRIRPLWPEPRANLCEALLRKGRIDPALWNCREAVRLEPNGVGLRLQLAKVLLEAGWTDEAIAELQQAQGRESGRNDARVDALLGLAFGRRGDPARGTLHVRRAIANDPRAAAPRADLGSLLLLAGDASGAERELRAALDAGIDGPDLRRTLADALGAQQREAEAAQQYRVALRLDSRSATAANNLAWILATTSDAALRAPDEALRWATVAAEVTQRRDPTVLDTLAVSQAAAGRYADAVETLDAAIALLPATNTAQIVRTQERRALFAAGRPLVEREATP